MTFIKQTKKYWLVLMIVAMAWLFLRHDAFLYTNPVGQVTRVSEKETQKITDEHQNSDFIMTQKLTVKLLNHAKKTIYVSNSYAQSQVISNKYRVGDQLLLENIGSTKHILSLKRDAVVGALATLLVGLLLIYSKWRATSWLMFSLVINIILFGFALFINVHSKDANVLLLFSVLAILFATASLALVLGKTLQMGITLLTTLLTTTLTIGLLLCVLRLTNNAGVHFETMSYVTQVPVTLFMAQTIIGVLGAVMDEAADIVAMQFGMRREGITRHFSDYWHAGMSVGREIMGTLINVLFMIFIAETMPMVFLMLRNGNNWTYIMDQTMNLGILQTVISGIGIVLAVPVTSALVGWIMARKVTKL
ncbi:YibE/F family protein [Leuconostoc gelidum subsp. gelidum]|uniref:YibE/F family protein n=2 Tax=Leuconostoc gelidum TaxID=1244 RepID=A0AB35FXM9_LEUGE|nr:YibE/F family protein [Leuconostoc gelidum]MBZ5964135.1 YibE/F family protein [Leuconostoc gelidum subsp. gelidum]MBZ5975824.1 YibE/F family protein [Leuconostoc gelidum subsp. gelidum]MBZ5976697.1 YibE/F family protein [Leuconostoc gelidum subsp. gelidum]MBZ5999825.1 YibE/F family protein [Leuconostoc gelidum subsp. gelidum]MBZ6015305.1 YibE/F family protein [Leuconostoc gelidum subsp. gelidum]